MLDAGGDDSVTESTYKIGALTIVPEILLDSTSQNSFYDSDKATSRLVIVNLAAVYKF